MMNIQLLHPGPLGILITITLLYAAYLISSQVYLWRQRRTLRRSKGVLPVTRYRTNDTIFGLGLLFANIRHAKRHGLLECQRARHTEARSNTIELRIGYRRHFSTLEPENLKTILATEFKKWTFPDSRKRGFRPLLGRGIFTTDGPEWERSRHMLRPNFVRGQLADVDMLEKHVSSLIRAIPRDASATVNLSDLFFRLTMDSATEFLFGESTNSLSRGSNEAFSAAFSAAQELTLFRARWGFLAWWISSNNTFDHDVAFINGFVDQYVTKALAPKNTGAANERYIFIDEITKHTRDPVRIRSELLNILLAGRDTTASLLTNVWWQLAQRHDVWVKLQGEVTSLGGQRPSFAELKDMRYLKAILNESLRLHPVVPLNSRQALEDTTLPVGGGPDGLAPIFVAKGERVAWSTYAMHRRQDIYGPDADGFRPERWLDKDTAHTGDEGVGNLRPGWGYLPFNGGPRICLGQQYALTEAGYTTVRLCQAFSGIENRGDVKWTEKMTLTCTNLDGAKVALTPRR